MQKLLYLSCCLISLALLLASSAEVSSTKNKSSGKLKAATTVANDPNPADLLEYVQTRYNNGAGALMNDPYAVAMSPDGAHLYAANYIDDSIWLFSRNRATGALTFVELIRDGDSQSALIVDGLNGAIGVAVSPAGLNVYVLSYLEGSIAAFSRNPADGRLTFIAKHRPEDGQVIGQVPSFPIAPAGITLLANRLYLGANLTISPDGQNVYATGFAYDTVVVFGCESDGTLTVTQLIDDSQGNHFGIDDPRGVTVSQDGKHVFVASVGADTVVVFERAADGSLNTTPAHHQKYQDGVDAIDGLKGANDIALSPGGEDVYVTGSQEDAVASFSRDANPLSATFGELTFINARFKHIDGVDGLDEARYLTVSPDGRYVFAAARYNDAVASFRRQDDGQLTYIEHIINGEGIDVGGASTPGADAIVATLDYDQYTTYVFQLTQEPLGNRAAGTPANLAAVNWLDAQFTAMGYAVERHAFNWSGHTLENVIATKIGATRPDQMYIISAHLDHVNNQGLLNRGADDDASGTAAVLEAARVFALPGVTTESSVRFVCWNAEERGLVGSLAYVNERATLRGIENPPGSGLYPEPDWLGLIQLDMILYDHGYGVLNSGAGPAYLGADLDMEYQRNSVFHAESLGLAHALHRGAGRFASIYPSQIGSNMRSTDSAAFQNYCPAVGLLENQVVEIYDREAPQSNPIYHLAGDVFEYYTADDYRYAFDYVQMMVGTVAALANGEMAISIGDPIRGLAEANDILVSPDGAHVYVTGIKDDALVTFILAWAEETFVGSAVEVEPLDKTTGLAQAAVTFSNVTIDGVTSVETSMDGPAPPSGFETDHGPLSYYLVETTAGYAGGVQLSLNYDPEYVMENTIRVLHYVNDAWVEVMPISVNALDQTVSFEAHSLGVFAIFKGAWSNRPATRANKLWQLYK